MLPTLAKELNWALLLVLACVAGAMDWRYRRIPNWLTVPAAGVGILLHYLSYGWGGAKDALLGVLLGLAILFPFVAIRSLGAGDWKLVGAAGAFLGPGPLLTVLFAGTLIAGAMALVVIIYKGRLRQALRNMGRILGSFVTLHRPGGDLSLDNPESLKVPFGVAFALAAILLATHELLLSMKR
ncbi:MAG TPA: A24 family peptidase [Terriglobales bacterium]|nr:A24 family peptidase [Terriglobales bacterium]